LLFEAVGYQRTEIWCDSPQAGQYRVRDLWNGHWDFESFRVRFQGEFEEFQSWIVADRVIEREELIGMYYEKDPDERNPGDEGEMVPG